MTERLSTSSNGRGPALTTAATSLWASGRLPVAVSLLRPGEVFSIHAFDVAQTEPAAAG